MVEPVYLRKLQHSTSKEHKYLETGKPHARLATQFALDTQLLFEHLVLYPGFFQSGLLDMATAVSGLLAGLLYRLRCQIIHYGYGN